MSKPDILQTEPRTSGGSREARRLRAGGRIPATIYGHGEATASLSLDAHDLGLALATPAQVFTLRLDRGEQPCLVREVQYDTFGNEVLHVDFMRVDLSEEVEVEVALDIVGHAEGLSEGGVQSVLHPTLRVHCRADRIPESLTVDVSSLGIGDAILAGAIALPEGVRLDSGHIPEDEPVVSIGAPQAVEEPVEGEEAEVPAEGEEAAAGETGEGEGEGGSPEGETDS